MNDMFKNIAVAYLSSRLVIFAIIFGYVGLQNGLDDVSAGAKSANITVSSISAFRSIRDLATINDAGWYHQIATEGYERRPFDKSDYANWAFFPLHPTIWKSLIGVFGDDPLVEVIFSNICFLVALIFIFKIIIVTGRSMSCASRAIFVLCFFPTSYFFSFPWTESLFLLLSSMCYFSVIKGYWKTVALTGALASATRFSGIFLLPTAGLFYVLNQASVQERISWKVLVLIGIIASGLIGFMALLAIYTGNPFAFSQIQSVWGRSFEIPIRAIGIIFLKPQEVAVPWNFRYLNFAVLALALMAVRYLIYRKEWAIACFLLLGIAAPLLTGNITSMSRYAMGLFPFAIAIADWTEGRVAERLWFSLSSATFALMCFGFVAKLNFAGT